MPCCSTTCLRSAPCGARRVCTRTTMPSPSAAMLACCRPDQTALRDRIDGILRAAMRDGRLERIFRKWRVWNDDQPRLYAEVLGSATSVEGRHVGTATAGDRQRPALLPRPAPRRGRHPRPLGRRDGSGRRRRSRDCDRPRVRRSRFACGAHCIRGNHSRHAGAAAALRDLLRPVRHHSVAGFCRGAPGTGPQLCRL